MDDPVDVLAVGAGFGGLALAAFCARRGLRVTVLERRPQLAPEGVGVVIQPNGLAVLEQLGVLDRALAVGQQVTTVSQCDPSGRVRARATYSELAHSHAFILVVERTVLISVLAESLPANVNLRCGCTVTRVERMDGRVVGVCYTNALGAHGTLKAGLVVGADGANSTVRAALPGVRLRWQTGPDRYLIGISPHEPTEDEARLYCGPGWCDGTLPLRGRTYFFDHIVGESQDAVERGDFESWRAIYSHRVPQGAEITAGLTSFEQVGFLSGRTHRCVPRVRPGVALLGDAAAAVHPHNGQGANLALEDAYALGTTLGEHGPADDRALAAYARQRDAKARRYVPWSLLIGRVLDGPSLGWRAARRISYFTTNHLPAARRDGVRRQAGLA